MAHAADDLDALTPAGKRWVERTGRALDILALIFLLALILLWSFPEAPQQVVDALNAFTWVVWACFTADYIARVTMAVNKRRYMAGHKLDLLMVVLPMLRLLRVFLVLRHSLSAVSTEKIAGSIFSIVVAVMFAAAYLIWQVESGAPGASITSFRTAVWWVFVTTTTVGYGDYTPVTPPGRAIAGIVMIVGIGLIGTVSATVAAWFVSRPNGETAQTEVTEPAGETAQSEVTPAVAEHTEAVEAPSPSELLARLDALVAQAAEIKALLEERQQPDKG